jgi:hypothetical protein
MTDRLPASHADHDLVLVAARAAGDVEAAERTRADELLASCAACAQIAADLRAIAVATAALPAPVRTRDFTLRPQDADRLRPSGWRRLVTAFGATRLELIRPLAPALTTLGLVGLLVSGLPLVQGSGGAFFSGSSAAAASPAASSAPAPAVAAAPAASAAASADTGLSTVKGTAPAPSLPERTVGGPIAGAASPSPISDTTAEGSHGPRAATTPPPSVGVGPGIAAGPEPNVPLAVASATLLILGLALFGLRRASRPRPTR